MSTEEKQEQQLSQVSTLRTDSRAIAPLYQPLQKRIEDLELDWDIRPEAFWRETLASLRALHCVVVPVSKQTSSIPVCEFPLSFIPHRYSFMSALRGIVEHADLAGIAMTVYVPLCQERNIVSLQMRHHILEILRKLTSHTQEVLSRLAYL